MMSTTGRMPVIAAPSPIPVMPASEIGESRTRSVPNSSTSPEVTLKGVPASATSSPMRNTVGSRRSSSASASLTACASEISRVPSCSLGTVTSAGVDMLVDLAGIGERGLERVLGGSRHLCLVLRAVVGAVDVADVVAVVAVCLADEKAGALAATSTLDGAVGGRVDGARVLPVDFLRRDPERRRPRSDVARGRLREVRVLVVGVVLADVDHRQLPEGPHVHHFVEDALAERALAEEADRDLVGTPRLGRERRAGRDAGRSPHDRVCAEIAVLVVGNVHRAALAAAVALLLAEELAEHTVDRRALRQAMAVAAVGARDVVVATERLADAHGDGFLTDVEMSQPWHLRAPVELVDALLEGADPLHLLVHPQGELRADVGGGHGFGRHHSSTRFRPAISASTS